MNYNNFNRIRELQYKIRELEEELERDDSFEEEVFVIAEIERLQDEVYKLSDGNYF